MKCKHVLSRNKLIEKHIKLHTLMMNAYPEARNLIAGFAMGGFHWLMAQPDVDNKDKHCPKDKHNR